MHGFCEKIAIFPSIVFYVEWIRVGLERNEAFSKQKHRFKKAAKLSFFQKG